MRTFWTLVAGWIAGGLVIVALAAPRPRHAGVTPARPAVAMEQPRAATAQPDVWPAQPNVTRPETMVFLQMPVAGVSRDQLIDTYTQARSGGRVHNAIDILAPRGTPVIAAVDGTIRKLFTSRAGGITIYEFDLKQERVYYYAHLDRYAEGIREGSAVQAGTVIGYVGTTGNAPPGTPHLHFAVENLPPTKEWWKGEPVNPYPMLTAR